MLRHLIEVLLLPPASVLALCLIGALLARKRQARKLRRLGRALIVGALLFLWLAATPAIGGGLLGALQVDPALPATGPLPEADAIVVLAAETDRTGGEYGGPTIGALTLQRVRYGAELARRGGLPLLMSGGVAGHDLPSVAALMAEACRQEFGVPVRWIEDRSADTWENAEYSAELLRGAGVQRVLLVSSAWHLPRAAAAFRRQGLEVIPAPTAFRTAPFDGWRAFVPHWTGLRDTCLALHEWVGRLGYRIVH